MGSSPISATRPVGQAAKTPPFHGGNTSSILVRVTKMKRGMQSIPLFILTPRRNDEARKRNEFAFPPKARRPLARRLLGGKYSPKARYSSAKRRVGMQSIPLFILTPRRNDEARKRNEFAFEPKARRRVREQCNIVFARGVEDVAPYKDVAKIRHVVSPSPQGGR